MTTELGAEVARQVTADLQQAGLPAVQVAGQPAMQVNDVAIHGYFISADEGSSVKRMLVGFGPIAEISVDAKMGGGFVDGSIGTHDEMTEARLTAVLIGVLAGRAAEGVILDTVTVNAGGADHSDLALATRLALRATCDCAAGSEPGVVLDPFIGSGTTAIAAQRLRRDWLGIELNPAFVALADERLSPSQNQPPNEKGGAMNHKKNRGLREVA